MWVTTARFAHCLRCTNCSRQFCTKDYTQCLTRNKREIRLASGNPTREQTTLQRTDWLSRNVTSGESKCGQRQLTSRRRSIPSPTNQFGTPQILQHRSRLHQPPKRRYTETATSKEQLRKMLCEFKKSAEKVWLMIHPDKTKILSNQSIINSDTEKGTWSWRHEKSKYWQEMKAWNI